MKLVRDAPGSYHTPDGKYEVLLVSDYETECEDPHPVRMRRDSIASYSGWFQRQLLDRNVSRDSRYITYQCWGGETHFYSRWTVGIAGSGDYAPGTGPDGFDTLADAREFVAALYEQEGAQ